MDENKSTALVIFQQLGGSRFVAMTGANHFVEDGLSLKFSIGKNKTKANKVHIIYDKGTDLYKMIFFRYIPFRLNRKTLEFSEEKFQTLAEIENLYADNLCPVFEKFTGLDIHL